MSESITCLIVDDHEVVREGLRLSLSRSEESAWSARRATAMPRSRWPSDASPTWSSSTSACPAWTGSQAAREITSEVPETSVLMFTAYAERSLLTRGLEAGAKGYILKEAPHQTLVRAIQKVADGDGYVDPALMPAFLTKERENMLTAREREILQLLADGMSNADVAAQAVHQPGDGQEPRAPYPLEARGGHSHACRRHRPQNPHHRLITFASRRGRAVRTLRAELIAQDAFLDGLVASLGAVTGSRRPDGGAGADGPPGARAVAAGRHAGAGSGAWAGRAAAAGRGRARAGADRRARGRHSTRRPP